MTEGRYRADGAQAEFEPGSRGRVLRNLLGIARVRDMQRTESESLLDVQEWAIGHFGASHRFTAADIVLLHRRWLGSIYPWAGEYRQVNVSKDGFMFAAAAQVPRLMDAFEAQELAGCTPCEGMDEAALVAGLARTHAELVLIHPFREGNGRCARLLGPSRPPWRATMRRWNAVSAACWRGLRALARRGADGAGRLLAERLEDAFDGRGAGSAHAQQRGAPARLAQPGVALQQ